MVENTIRVIIDEELSKFTGQSGLVAILFDNGHEYMRLTYSRDTGPDQISEDLNFMGCSIKYSEDNDLSEEDRENTGGLYVQASYNVPGLGK